MDLELTMQTTEVKESSISSLPGLAFVDTLAFPTEEVFERIKAGEGTATVTARNKLLEFYVVKKKREKNPFWARLSAWWQDRIVGI